MNHPVRARAGAAAALLGTAALLGLAGCGGGGGSSTPVTPTTRSLVSGTVTDINGAPIVGATVTVGAQTTTTTQFGDYALSNIPVGTATAVATDTINGAAWSGQNTLQVLSSQTNTSNVHIVLSPTAQQGALSGTVKGQSGPLAGVQVSAAIPDPTNPALFLGLSSFSAVTDQNGAYSIAHLPANANYTITASFAGYLNQTVTGITIAAGGTTTQPFTLTTSINSPTLPAVTNFSALTIEVPSTLTRAAGTSGDTLLALVRQVVLQRRGLLGHRAADPKAITLQRSATRSTPSGSLIEGDLFWDYAAFNNLYGYEVDRSASDNAHFASIALLRDPLADRFTDVDSALTPDVPYFYSVARLDTINYPTNANTTVVPVNPVEVEPLGPLSLVSPTNAVTTGAPTFAWSAVNRAALYQVLVYDRFPSLQSSTDTTNGVTPIWTMDTAATSQAYQGPTLTSGHTYYWTVIGQDNADPTLAFDFTAGPLRSFVAQ